MRLDLIMMRNCELDTERIISLGAVWAVTPGHGYLAITEDYFWGILYADR